MCPETGPETPGSHAVKPKVMCHYSVNIHHLNLSPPPHLFPKILGFKINAKKKIIEKISLKTWAVVVDSVLN